MGLSLAEAYKRRLAKVTPVPQKSPTFQEGTFKTGMHEDMRFISKYISVSMFGNFLVYFLNLT